MLPKTIHCFWEGGEMTRLARRCLASWRRVMPDWTIEVWNLERLRAEGLAYGTPFFEEAVAAKKWGFAIDVVRWAVLARAGGIFLDADVELVKPLPEDGPWLAAEQDEPLVVNPGLGVAFPAGHPFVHAMLDAYAPLHFNPRDMLATASPWIVGRVLAVTEHPRILPARVMNPIGGSGRRLGALASDCCAIHWYAASWMTWRQRLVYVTLPRKGIDVGKAVRWFRR